MKIISAGFPKTGTKSASEALRRDFNVLIMKFSQMSHLWLTNRIGWNPPFRILGYSVCDVLDSAHSGIAKNWLDFMNGECTIEEVVEAYHRHGYGTKPWRNFFVSFIVQMRPRIYLETFTGNRCLKLVQARDQWTITSWTTEWNKYLSPFEMQKLFWPFVIRTKTGSIVGINSI